MLKFANLCTSNIISYMFCFVSSIRCVAFESQFCVQPSQLGNNLEETPSFRGSWELAPVALLTVSSPLCVLGMGSGFLLATPPPKKTRNQVTNPVFNLPEGRVLCYFCLIFPEEKLNTINVKI